MTYDEARLQILLHGIGTTNAQGEPWVLNDGFLGSLRPYRGLVEKNFHQVMEALLTVGERIHQESQIDRELVLAVWSLCSTARMWGLSPDGMLQGNRLITTDDTVRLTRQIETIEDTALRFLGGRPPDRAVYHYAEYIVTFDCSANAAFFVELMARAVLDPRITDSITMISRALGAMGKVAAAALPALREAEQREYTWWTPAARCTEDVRAEIRRAIDAITASGELEA